jgi:hypothetical protein
LALGICVCCVLIVVVVALFVRRRKNGVQFDSEMSSMEEQMGDGEGIYDSIAAVHAAAAQDDEEYQYVDDVAGAEYARILDAKESVVEGQYQQIPKGPVDEASASATTALDKSQIRVDAKSIGKGEVC